MSGIAAKLRTFAELGRVSNLPTTISNVLTGAALGTVGLPWTGADLLRVGGTWIAIACFYIAGMAMNDVVDAKVDAVERPNRPIPSGRVPRPHAAAFTIVLLVVGLLIFAMMNLIALVCAVVLVALIAIYNLIHQSTAASVIPLGCARGMVYVVAAVSLQPRVDWAHLSVFAGALAAYTALFSLVARSETQKQLDRRRWVAVFLPFIAAAPLVLSVSLSRLLPLLPLAIMLAWLSRGIGAVFASPPRTREAVMAWISGICLIDAVYLAQHDRPALMAAAGACFILTLVIQRRIAGT